VAVEVGGGQLEERALNPEFAVIFEQMNGLAQGPLIVPDGTGVIKRGRCCTTGATAVLRTVG
jgi:hypothetical protein